MECRSQCTSNNPNQGVPVAITQFASQTEEHAKEDIERGLNLRSSNQGIGDNAVPNPAEEH
jgi:hypothetical protein